MCKYCNTENRLSGHGDNMYSKPHINVSICNQTVSNKPYIVISEYEKLYNGAHDYGNSPFRGNEFRINFCPMCGKDLR